MKTGHMFLAAALAVVNASGASVTDLSEKKVLTLDGARKVIAGAAAQARVNQSTGAFAVVDDGGNLLALERIEGTFAAGTNLAIGKARTAAMFKLPTRYIDEGLAKGGASMGDLGDYTGVKGGVPLIVNGQIVGAIGVSGSKDAEQDNELAVAGAASLNAAPPPVAYFDKRAAAAAFADGSSILFNNEQSYMVQASRRERPGVAEVHVRDTDIIYVLQGSATFVTGGAVAETASVVPDEIRGQSIEGGETRQLGKGDVIIVPAGTPHWFKEVSNPFLYYVVKAR